MCVCVSVCVFILWCFYKSASIHLSLVIHNNDDDDGGGADA